MDGVMLLLKRGNDLVAIVVVLVVVCLETCSGEMNRASFPKGFVFGTAASAYQVGLFLFFTFFQI